jgi:exodeoxyribonuclease-3
MRIISFCANGIEQAASRGFYDWLSQQDADVVCIQDIRAQEYLLKDDFYFPPEYNIYFFDNPESTNGVALYCRDMPKAIMTGLGFNMFDSEARYIQADFDRISFGSILAPESFSDNPKSIKRKLNFFEQLHDHLAKIKNKRREFVICGNLFIAHQPRDLTNSKSHQGDVCFTDKERAWLDKIFIDLGYVDAFRSVISDDDEFTWWPGEDLKGDALRVDYQIASPGLRKHIEYATILKTKFYSQHAPLIVDYDYEISIQSDMGYF